MENRSPERAGLLLVDKPAGITSHDVVAVIRRTVRVKRVGHTGTLDPFATGLLVVLVGRATRLIPYIDGEPKIYDATIRFGVETDTDDITGVATRAAPIPDESSILAGLTRLTGDLEQEPPAYSAKKVAGRRAYDAARRGDPLVLAPANVTVHEWRNPILSGADLTVRIVCGGGTYIRSLARDLGRLTDSAAHLATLRRVRSGTFDVNDAQTLDDIDSRGPSLRPIRDAVSRLPEQRLDVADLVRARHGNPVAPRVEGGRVVLLDDAGELVAIAEREGSALRPKTVLIDA